MSDRREGLRRPRTFQKTKKKQKYRSSPLALEVAFPSTSPKRRSKSVFISNCDITRVPRKADKFYTPPRWPADSPPLGEGKVIGTPGAVWGLEIMLSAATFDQSRCDAVYARGVFARRSWPQRSHSLSSPPEQLTPAGARTHARTQTHTGDRHTQLSVCVLP